MKTIVSYLTATLLFTPLLAVTQDTAPNTSAAAAQAPSGSASVPRFVRFSGAAKDPNGEPLIGTVGITFSFYRDQEGGAPLWLETQNVKTGPTGSYTVQLGATQPEGLPTDIFAYAEARWLGVQIVGQAEQPRVLLLSVPYALKAADAETLGGMAPSAFVLAAPQTKGNSGSSDSGLARSSGNGTASSDQLSPALTGGGTPGAIPIWTTASNLGNSAISQSGGIVSVARTLHVDQVPGANGSDVLQVTSGGSTAVASLLLRNTGAGGLRLRQGVGTGLAYLASSGPLGFITNDTGTPSFPSAPKMLIDGAGNVGIGTTTPNHPLTVVSNSFQPLFVQSSSTFGTWLQLNNTSAGGHNWAILSAGGANSEGAGNLGITNFTGTSTIFLEGNVKANSLNSSGNVNVDGNATVAGNLDIGFSYVIGPTATVSSGTTATIVAICPAGTRILSGGFDIGGPGVDGARVLTSVPGLVAQDRWVVRLHNDGGADIQADAEAVCARLVVAQCCTATQQSISVPPNNGNTYSAKTRATVQK